MVKKPKQAAIVFVSILALLGVQLTPLSASAEWHGQADELPGLVSGKTLVIVGLVTAAVVIIVLQASKKAQETEGGEFAPPDSTEYPLPEDSTRGTAPGLLKLKVDGGQSHSLDEQGVFQTPRDRRAVEWRPVLGFSRESVSVGIVFDLD